jgi:hypothetical protein
VLHWLKGDTIDALFIDGNKLNFATDFGCYFGMMTRPGVVFMHDIQDEDPALAYWRVLRDFGLRHEEIIDTSEVALAKATPPSERTPHENWLVDWDGRSCGVGCLFIGD